MSQTPEPVAPDPSAGTAPQKPGRPFRVKFRGSVLTLMRLPNRREVRGKLHQLSTTGGLMHVETPLDEKLELLAATGLVPLSWLMISQWARVPAQ